jgi:rubrerythrin
MRERARAGSLQPVGPSRSGIDLEGASDMANAPNRIRSATREDLLTAMQREAFAYASYMLFAGTAREDGRKEIADLFETIAQTELHQHFARLAEEAGLVGGDADNLRAAIEAESYAIEIMYPSFAEHAAAAGDTGAAGAFTTARNDDLAHLESFREALLDVSP